MDAKKGDIKFYHESGDIWRVEVLEAKRKDYGNSRGEEYRLKLLEIIDTTAGNPPEKGLEFTVWKAEDAGSYAGWHLLDM